MERKSSAYLNSDDMFSTYAQKTYMENIPCELVFRSRRNNDVGLVRLNCLSKKLKEMKFTVYYRNFSGLIVKVYLIEMWLGRKVECFIS